MTLAAVAVMACQPKEPAFLTTDKGPQQTVNCDATALMGSDFRFTVDLQDPIALSTLKVQLKFDDTVVADTTIRTKTNGTYAGRLLVPFYKDIPDGVATAVFTSQNIQFGVTTEEKDVHVTRPEFEYLLLKPVAGGEYRMEKTGEFTYAVSGDFDASVDAFIETAPFDAAGRKFSFGYGATGVDLGGTTPIPFSNGVAGNYEISFNTRTWEAAPFVKLTVNGTEAVMIDKQNYAAVVNLRKGEAIVIEGYAPGFDDFTLDPDWFTEDFKFNAVDGLYKVTIQMGNKFFLVEKMVSADTYASLTNGNAVWLIGDGYGKPGIFSASWNTGLGLCLAEVEPNIHQITFVGGTSLKTGTNLNVKLFHQKGWGGEFGGGSYASVVSDLAYAGESDGNIHLLEGQSIEMGGIYRFTLDLTGGVSAAVLKVEKVGQQEVESDKITVNGVELEMLSANEYAGKVSLKKGDALSVKGIDDLASWWFDPDFVAGGKWNAVDGDYVVTLDKGIKVGRAYRVNGAGARANLAEGGLYVQGWGIAPYMMDGGQVGWPGAGGYQLAQVSEGVFQMTGKAVGEKDSTIGGRWRIDYANFKFFFQDGWGGESSKEIAIDGNAAEHLSQGSDGNLNLVGTLEEGATYRMTVDFTGCTIDGNSITAGKEMITFEKL
jgi:hypothetical protein